MNLVDVERTKEIDHEPQRRQISILSIGERHFLIEAVDLSVKELTSRKRYVTGQQGISDVRDRAATTGKGAY